MICARCGSTNSAYSMSYFNTETICLDCVEIERAHPEFEHAREVETEQVRKGNFNFPGVGLPADLRDN